MTGELSTLGAATLATAAVSAILLLDHVIRRPPLGTGTRVRLLLGLGVFPMATAALNTAEGMRKTASPAFCGSCHVMTAHLDDARDPHSASLAARHARNAFMAESSCYACHADYGMLGYSLTKLTGMKHVYKYYFAGYRSMTREEAARRIRMERPYPNGSCVQCHSGRLDSWHEVREHAALRRDLEAGRVACASAGCHGWAHPFDKAPGPAELGRAAR